MSDRKFPVHIVTKGGVVITSTMNLDAKDFDVLHWCDSFKQKSGDSVAFFVRMPAERLHDNAAH